MRERGRASVLRWAAWCHDHRWHANIALALLIGTIAIVGTLIVGRNQPDRQTPDAVALALLAAGATALVFRRHYPSWVLIIIKMITLLYLLLDYPKGPNFLPLVIAFLTAVLQGHRLIAWAVLAGEFVLFPWLPYVIRHEPAPTSGELFGLAGWLLVLATVAEIIHIRQQRFARAREEAARRRADEERLQIARDLHDVLGHNISLISVQAGVALHLMDQQPEQARVALSVIKDASKDALRELRSVLDVLRRVDEIPPHTPSPGLAGLDDLVSRAAEAGMQVQVDVSADLTRLPTSVDSTAFRIIQEALTNVIRHSGQSASSVHVACTGRELTLRVDNPVSGAASRERGGPGRGIRGMQERATALGGTVEAGPHSGGFRVFARFPLPDNLETMPGEKG